jgi:hypothetical protein
MSASNSRKNKEYTVQAKSTPLRSSTNPGLNIIKPQTPQIPEYVDQNITEDFVFTIVRMNPPTIGHIQLITAMINFALEKNIEEVFIFLSEKGISQDDPLDCEYRKGILDTMIFNLRISIASEIGKDLFHVPDVNVVCSSNNFRDVYGKISNSRTMIKVFPFSGEDSNSDENVARRILDLIRKGHSEGKLRHVIIPPANEQPNPNDMVRNVPEMERLKTLEPMAIVQEILVDGGNPNSGSLDPNSGSLDPNSMSSSVVKKLCKWAIAHPENNDKILEAFTKLYSLYLQPPRMINDLFERLKYTLQPRGGKRRKTIRKRRK